MPSSAQTTTLTIVSSVAADAFSRGSEIPVTPSDPTLFYRAASEMLCENIAPQVVDPTAGTDVYPSADVPGAIARMVETIDGLPARGPAPRRRRCRSCTDHYNAAPRSSSAPAATTAKATNAHALDVRAGLPVAHLPVGIGL